MVPIVKMEERFYPPLTGQQILDTVQASIGEHAYKEISLITESHTFFTAGILTDEIALMVEVTEDNRYTYNINPKVKYFGVQLVNDRFHQQPEVDGKAFEVKVREAFRKLQQALKSVEFENNRTANAFFYRNQ